MEDLYWACDGHHQQFVDQFIIHFGDGESDSDNESNVLSSLESDTVTDDDDCCAESDCGSISGEDEVSLL